MEETRFHILVILIFIIFVEIRIIEHHKRTKYSGIITKRRGLEECESLRKTQYMRLQ